MFRTLRSRHCHRPSTHLLLALIMVVFACGLRTNAQSTLVSPIVTVSFAVGNSSVNTIRAIIFRLVNPNSVAIDASFDNVLPSGLQVASSPNVRTDCGGTLTAVPGSSSISFNNTLLPPGICTISVNFIGTTDNSYTDSVQILSSDAGNGNTSSSNITFINPPDVTNAFGAAGIPLNGITTSTFTLASNNANLSISGTSFTDNLPAGLVVAPTPNLTNTCGGTATAVGGSSLVSLTGGSLAPSSSCRVPHTTRFWLCGVQHGNHPIPSHP